MYIAVCGNIYSGKSTLCQIISNAINAEYIPSQNNRKELDYLDDFFDNIEKMFLSTQSTFIIEKAKQIIKFFNIKKNVVVDRSIYEDINVFAKYWMDNYNISSFDKGAFMVLSDFINEILPKPDILIFCKCPLNLLLKRQKSREKRSFEKKYPIDYTNNLQKIYENDPFFQSCFQLDMEIDLLNKKNQYILNDLISDIKQLMEDIDTKNLLLLKRGRE